MATTIQVKRSDSVTDSTISGTSLAYGELAYSFESATNKLWIGNASNAAVEVGGSFFTGLFGSNTTNGTNDPGKILITDSSGNLDFNDKNLTNVNNFDADSVTIGNGDNTATLTNASTTFGITGATGVGIKLTAPTGAGITLDGDSIAGTTIKDEDDMTSNSATHIASQQSIKAYVDTKTDAVDKISEGNSSVEVIDAGTGSIVNTLEGNAVITINPADTIMTAADFRLKLKSPDTSNAQDAKDTSLQFLDSGNSVLGEVKGAHDGTSTEDRGVIVFSTNNGTASTEAVRIDSGQNVTIAGDLTVNGTRNIVNTTVTSLDDPVLTLGGNHGGVSTASIAQPSTAWGVDQVEVVVEQASSNGAGQGASFAITTNNAGAITAATVVNAGINYVNSGTITLNDPTSTGSALTLTITAIVAGPSADDNMDRGIEFNYYSGSAKVGFFGFDDSTGKFTFIPEATKGAAEVFGGTAGTIVADLEGAVTGNVTGNLTGTVNTVTQNSITTMTGLVQTGTIANGAIDASSTNNFPITMGTSNITSSGEIVINVDGTAKSTNGAITLGAGADGALWVDSGDDLNVYNQGQIVKFDAAKFELFNKKTEAGDHYSDLYVGKAATDSLNVNAKMNSSNELLQIVVDTPTQSTTDDAGKIIWKIDAQEIFTIQDDGIKGVTDGSNPFTSPDGTSGQSKPYIDNFIISGGTFS